LVGAIVPSGRCGREEMRGGFGRVQTAAQMEGSLGFRERFFIGADGIAWAFLDLVGP
jgi:hypothetical protein